MPVSRKPLPFREKKAWSKPDFRHCCAPPRYFSSPPLVDANISPACAWVSPPLIPSSSSRRQPQIPFPSVPSLPPPHLSFSLSLASLTGPLQRRQPLCFGDLLPPTTGCHPVLAHRCRRISVAIGYPAMDVAKDACPAPKLHTRLRLWEFADHYIFEPVDGLADLYLSVSRTNGSMDLVQELPPRGPSINPKVRIVFGVIGLLKLAVGSYFLVITDRDCVGSYLGDAIFKVTGLKVLPCNNLLSTSSAEQKKIETEFKELLDAAERTIGLYFSYETNLTLTSQRLYDLGNQFMSLPLWRQVTRKMEDLKTTYI